MRLKPPNGVNSASKRIVCSLLSRARAKAARLIRVAKLGFRPADAWGEDKEGGIPLYLLTPPL